MSIFASMDTTRLRSNAQAAAIGHISDNVANASTNGYRQVSTAFSDLVTNKLKGASPVVDSTRNMGVLALADFNNRKNGQIIHDDSLTSIAVNGNGFIRSEEHTSELQSLMRISYAVFCLKKKTIQNNNTHITHNNATKH